ncbi:MAG: hypothetical protein IT245_06880 [Bacteroidia bacterium]|nr:hypothetical protein [Bacteroidia bacterium]
MNRLKLILLFFCAFIFKINAQTNERQLIISKDSIVKSSYKNYDEIQFRDSSGFLHSGTIFMPNDSQFYFINYFKEKKGKTYNLSDIYSIDVFEYSSSGAPPPKRKGRFYLSPLAVIGIIIFTSYIGIVYLIVREIHLTKKEGPQHSKYYQVEKKLVTLKHVKAQIVISGT